MSSLLTGLRGVEPELLLRYDGFMRRLAGDLLADADAADDVAQQAWHAALERPPASRFAWASWLRRVVERLAARRRRADRRRRARELAAARPERLPSDQDIWQREDARRAAVTALLALPEPYRATLVLRYLEDLTPATVAERLRVPVETVRTRCKRGVQMIRQQWDEGRGHGRDWRCALLALPFADLGRRRTLATAFTPVVILMTTPAKLKVLAAALLMAVGGLTWWQFGSDGASATPAAAGDAAAASLSVGTAAAVADESADSESADSGSPSRALLAPPASIAPAPLGELRVRAWLVGGAPAAQLPIAVTPRSAPVPRLARVVARTDAQGLVVLPLAPGPVEVHAPLATSPARVRATVTAGAVTECDLREVQPCALVRGQVVDPQGRGVPGATLLGAEWGGGEAIAVGESGADGRFVLAHCAHSTWLGARHDDFAPSPMRSMAGPPDTELTVRLELGRDAGLLRGTVFDPRGRPMAGAFVRAGRETLSLDVPLADGGVGKAPAPVLARTGADGSFVFRGLPAATMPLSVRAPGYARFATSVTLEARRPSEVVVRLVEGAVVEGRATMPDGQPAAKAEIRGEPADGVPGSAEVSAVADADGRFALRDLPAGKLKLRATRQGAATVPAEFDLVAGATVRWDVAFVAVAPIVGQVVDSQGRGVAGAQVSCWVNTRGGSAETDAQGHFEIDAVGERTRGMVEVRLAGSLSEALTLRDVALDAGPLLLRLPPGAEDLVEVCGRALDMAGRPQAGAEIGVGLASSGNSIIEHTDADGRFRLGKFPRAELRVTVEAAGHARVMVRRTPPGGVPLFDVGDLTLAPAARLRLRLTMADGSSVPAARETNGHRIGPVFATVTDLAGASVARLDALADGDLLRTDLAAGRYRVVVTPESKTSTAIACTTLEVEVVAGEERSYTVALRSGVRCRFATPRSADGTSTRVLVHADDGAYVASVWLSGKGERVSGTTVLAPGSYRATWGERSKEFSVGADAASDEVSFD